MTYGWCSGIEEIDKTIKKKSLENRVYIERDFISLEEMAEIYNMTDLCFVTEDTDELSQAILESMACRCIPVLSNISAYKKKFKEYDNCLYVNQKDINSYMNVIFKYIEEKKKIKNNIIKKNIELVKNDYNRELQMPKIMDMYNEIISERCQ